MSRGREGGRSLNEASRGAAPEHRPRPVASGTDVSPPAIEAWAEVPSVPMPRKKAAPSASSPVATRTWCPLGHSFSTESKPIQPRPCTWASAQAWAAEAAPSPSRSR